MGGQPDHLGIVLKTFVDDFDQAKQAPGVVDAPISPVFCSQASDLFSLILIYKASPFIFLSVDFIHPESHQDSSNQRQSCAEQEGG